MSSTLLPFQDDAAHVLVVDDDRRLRALLSSYLVKHGHRVTVAPTAAKARAFLEGLAFDIIVLDVMMPVENGFDFAADLRGRSQVPILMLTARGEAQDRVRGLEIGVDDYLAKPFEPRELLLRIGSVLRRTRAAPAGGPQTTVVRFGRFAFSLERGELRAGDEPVRITEREREMLRLLERERRRDRVPRGAVGIGRRGPGADGRRAGQPASAQDRTGPCQSKYTCRRREERDTGL